MSVHKHVLSVTVRDRPGVLVRIASLFARRGFNIESLSVAQSHLPAQRNHTGVGQVTAAAGRSESILGIAKEQSARIVRHQRNLVPGAAFLNRPKAFR